MVSNTAKTAEKQAECILTVNYHASQDYGAEIDDTSTGLFLTTPEILHSSQCDPTA
jgi:hypothetical protein